MIGPQTEPAPYYPVEHVPHNLIRNLRKTFAAFFSTSRVIYLLFTKIARDHTGRISALGLFCIGTGIVPNNPAFLLTLKNTTKKLADLFSLSDKAKNCLIYSKKYT